MTNRNNTLELFSKEGKAPSYLPLRFRLPSGETRYSSNCSLQEIYSAGFLGPYEYPYVTKDQLVLWDTKKNTFVVRDRLPEEYFDPVHINLEVRALASLQLSALPDLTLNTLDEAYKQAWTTYSSHLITLLNLPETVLATYEDLPSYPLVLANQSKFDESLAAITIEINYNRWKEQFETYGFIFYIPEEVIPYFAIPSDWVRGSSPLPEETSNHFEHSLS